jgi:Pyruvate/2-oxoacid:ferredoxin oxidoreductase delta subunit/flavodoxin
MKIGIVYLSGTGGTARYAQEIGTGFRDMGHELTIRRFDRILMDELQAFDLIGFGCPTYSYRAPYLFTSYLRSLPGLEKPYFLFCTCGGNEGNTIWNLYHEVQKKKGVFLGSIVGKAPDNIRAWRPKLTDPAPVDEFSAETLQLAHDFASTVISQIDLLHADNPGPPGRVRNKAGWRLWGVLMSRRWEMARLEGHKGVDLSKCTACGLCATKICPAGAITLDDQSHPVFSTKKCIGCSGCVNLCPQLAISSRLNVNRHPYVTYGKLVFTSLT